MTSLPSTRRRWRYACAEPDLSEDGLSMKSTRYRHRPDPIAGSARVPGARHELIKADELTATSQNLAHPQFLDPKLAS